jgi:VanZ family protein
VKILMMLTTNIGHSNGYRRSVRIACVALVAIVLVAGLWPLHAPENRVTWLAGENGVHFARYGAARSSSAFKPRSESGDVSESIEVWLRPDSGESTNTILSFDELNAPGTGFVLRQYRDLLMLRRRYIDEGGSKTDLLGIRNAARGKQPVFVTITIGPQGTAMYLDGVPRGTLGKRGTQVENFVGHLVVADSQRGRDTWSGEIRGVAIYATALAASQVAEHYESWTQDGRPTISNSQMPIALYLFDEHKGRIAHNRVKSGNDIVIPARYFALNPPFLASVKRDYRPTLGYWLDNAVNIAGFIPLGFALAILWAEVHVVKYPAATTIVCGLLISFAIEVLQAFLPTRSSGCTDLITNTLGTTVGFMIYRSSRAQHLLSNFRQRFFGTSDSVDGDSSNSVPLSEERASLSA